MLKRMLLAFAFLGLFAFTATGPGRAADPPTDQGMTAEPEDPDAAPYPPDGVIDPNADYPVDGSEGTDQGEPGGAAAPATNPAPAPAAKAPQ